MNNKDKNKFQEVFEENQEFKKVLFFLFYLIFFIVIILLLRGSFKNNVKNKTIYNSGYNHSFNLDNINNGVYQFNYKETKNGVITIYEGSKNGLEQNFIMSGDIASEYNVKNNNFYKKNSNTLQYELSTNPMIFYNIIDYESLKKLFIHGTYRSITEYLNSEEKEYNYEIATSTILKKIDNMETDLDGINKIIAKVDEDGEVYELDLDLTDYMKFFDTTIHEYRLELKYLKNKDS